MRYWRKTSAAVSFWSITLAPIARPLEPGPQTKDKGQMEETKIKRPEIVGDDSLVLYCNQYSYYCQKVKFYTHTHFNGEKGMIWSRVDDLVNC